MLPDIRALARRAMPYSARVELARLRHLPARILRCRGVARERGQAPDFEHVLADRSSPIHRRIGPRDERLEDAKERNVIAAAARIDRIVIRPHQVFSWHAAVGRPSVLRGFRRGLELHDERPAAGVGGGVCKLSNMLYLLALLGGMKIVERHRHALDLFPDKGRTVPFGCGATVFYNYADFRFENPLPQPVLLLTAVRRGELVGEIRAARDPGWRAEIYETDHRFVRVSDGWERENTIRRRFVRFDGSVLVDEQVAHNRGRVLYEPHFALPPDSKASMDTKRCCAR
jgi:vancomycin resistance protein VanW